MGSFRQKRLEKTVDDGFVNISSPGILHLFLLHEKNSLAPLIAGSAATRSLFAARLLYQMLEHQTQLDVDGIVFLQHAKVGLFVAMEEIRPRTNFYTVA